MRRLAVVATAAVFVSGCAAVAFAAAPAPSSTSGLLECYNGFTGTPLDGGVRLECEPDPTIATTVPPTTVATTSTTTTTVEPTTTVASTTLPPVTTTVAPTTTTTVAPTTTLPPVSDDFVEDFTGNTGLERFATGVYHRDGLEADKPATVSGDHDLDCGPPDTQRTIHRDNPAESFYMCRDHLMTAVGDWTGYSIAWFSPDQTFSAATTTSVSWDVNVTNLGGRQWWEVAIIPTGQPHLATVDWVAAVAGIDAYGPGTISVGSGPLGNDGSITLNGVEQDPLDWNHICNGNDFQAGGTSCDTKADRRTFTVTDNQNGTITVLFLGQTYTYPGAFPETFGVYFKDHNYTPDKDCGDVAGGCVGYTWHFDNIAVS